VYEVSGEHIDLLAGNSGVMHGQLGDQTAKHYTPLLSLMGVQLHPNKPPQQTVTGSDDSNVPAFPGLTGAVTAANGSEVVLPAA
jgi:hypothetical protein